MFEALPLAPRLLVIPLVTMRALAEEKRSGTLELLITMPVTDSEVILGKYLAALGDGASSSSPRRCSTRIAMFEWPWHLGALDWGPVWAGYLGLRPLLGAAASAVGLLLLEPDREPDHRVLPDGVHARPPTSSARHARRSGVATASSGDVARLHQLPVALRRFARGLIDTRAIVYFLSVTVICLLVRLPLAREPEVV